MKHVEVLISQLGRIITGKTPSTKKAEMFGGQYAFVTPTDLDWKTYYVRSTERTVSGSAKEAFPNQFISPDSVLVTCIGATIGKCGLAAEECLTNQQINSIVPEDPTDGRFIYYLLIRNIKLIRGVGLGGGAATPILNKTTFSKIRLHVPPKNRWAAIADILSAYDDLIENNRRRIQLLEQAARLLYKEWFVNLRFPGHEHVKIKDGVPDGWERKFIMDVWDISYGKNLPKKNIKVSGKYPVHGADTIIGFFDEKNVNTSLCLITCRGNGSGNIRRTFGPTFVTNNCFILRPKLYPDEIKFHFTMITMEQLKLRELRTGAAQPQLTLSGIGHLQIKIPSRMILSLFNAIVDPLFKQADMLRKQVNLLAQARDLLLPRLMNGEIAV